MSNVGGSANINGILYQILGTLDQTITLDITGAVTSSDDILEARIVVEPASGGDLQKGSYSGRVVQQWKAKSRGGSWSLKKIIEDVLPDLYLAVPDADLGSDCRYEFVTEGDRGRWGETYDFFHSLSNDPSPQLRLDVLDDTRKRHKVGATNFSDRALISHIVTLVRKRGSISDEPIDLSRQKVWHLLRRFVMDAPFIQEQLVVRINQVLAHHVEIVEDVDNKRRELCGILLEVASEGEKSISAEWLFRKAGIPLHSFRCWTRLKKRLDSRLQEQLAKEQYDIALDVRPSLNSRNLVTVISGESGQGKTWRLARFASDMARNSPLVMWVPSWRATNDVAEYASREIWNYGLERDAQLSLERIASRRAHSAPDAEIPWAIICIDDIHSSHAAAALLNMDWRRWGISIALSVTPEVAQSIALSHSLPNAVVRDFEHSELRDYLERRGIPWANMAHDVRELIRRPVLAKVYGDIADGNSDFNPYSEYSLMEAAWARINDPIAIGAMRTLAGTLGVDGSTYPWPAEELTGLGIALDSINRLMSRGWLRDAGEGRVEIWHYRFLNWAYAKFLAHKFTSGQLSIEQLCDRIRQCHRDQPRLRLGYVPMHVLWILFEPSVAAGRRDLWRLIVSLEKYAGMGYEDEGLYKILLASLGSRAIPFLLERTRQSGEEKHNPIPRRVSEALFLISRDNSELISKAIQVCLADTHLAMIELGLRLAPAFPNAISPDRVWEVYRQEIIRVKVGATDYIKQELTAKAFLLVVEQSLTWFKRKLREGDDNDSCFAALVYALANLGHSKDARQVWLEVKDQLISTMPSGKRRCLVFCIENFLDTDEYPRLEEWSASDEELVGGRSAWALAYRAPARALRVLPTVPVKQLWGIGISLGTALMATLPHEMCEEVNRLIQSQSQLTRAYVDFYWGHGDRLNDTTIELLLDLLEQGLSASLDGTDENARGSGRIILGLVESLYGTNVLMALRNRRDTMLESTLVEFACSRIDRSHDVVDHEFEHACNILRRIAGDGFTILTNTLISAEHRYLRLVGCEAAVVRPNDETRVLLAKEALSDVMWGSGTTGVNLVQLRALDSLAALGEGAALTRGIMKWGLDISPDIGDLREGQSPFSNSDLRPALEVLDYPDHPQYAHAILAVGQSGRTDFQDRIGHILLNSDYKSPIAQACLLALDDLASNCDQILNRLIQQYRSGHHKFAVLKVLGRCNVSKEDYVRLLPEANALDEMDERVVSYLASDKITRPLVDRHVRELIKHGGHPFSDVVELLDLEHEVDREMLWKRTLQPDAGIHTVGSKAAAIKALGAVAADAAFEISIESLLHDRRDRDTIPEVLLEIDLERAIKELCRAVQNSNDKSLCCSVGRALREYASASQLGSSINDLLTSSNWKSRRAGAFIAGFLEASTAADVLQRVAYGDPKSNVCYEAQLAIRAHQREMEAVELVQMMTTDELQDVWGTIDNIVHLTDPDILVNSQDPTGFLQALRQRPFVVRAYATDMIKRRSKKMEDDMKSLSGKWKEED